MIRRRIRGHNPTELMPAVIILIERILDEEQLGHAQLRSDEPLPIMQRRPQPRDQRLIRTSCEHDLAPPLEVRRIAVEVLEAGVHVAEDTSAARRRLALSCV